MHKTAIDEKWHGHSTALVHVFRKISPEHTLLKKFIVPTWVEVHPATELYDIRWEPPVVKKQAKKEIKTFTSSSDASIKYQTSVTHLPTGETKYNCNCPGKWRAKDGECKHIKALKNT